MSSRRFNLPSVSSLIAFEAVARLQGFARAAEELNTSQPAVSRHIRNLEIRYGAELFHRDRSPICLTEKGSQFYSGVIQGFDALQTAVEGLSQRENRVTLVCSHSVSHLLVMPRYGRLRTALGSEIELRVMTAEYNLVQAAVDTGADIVFEYSATPPDTPHVVVCREEIRPVGTPAIIEQSLAALDGRGAPPPILRLKKDNFGWMGWSDWKAAHPAYASWQVGGEFDSYVYLLESAASGAGLGLGWRSFVDPYVARGDLMEMPVEWFSRGTRIFARLTRFGQQNAAAHRCLAMLENL